MSRAAPSDFTRELIDELSEERFRPRAWLRFLSRSWERSLADMRESPALTRSFLRSAAAIALVGLLVLALASGQSTSIALESLAYWLPWYGLAAGFVMTHLGMSDDGAGKRVHRFHLPNQLSFARLSLAPLILFPGFSLPGQGAGASVFAVFVAVLALSDVLDGWIARRTGTCTRLGQMLDYFGDLGFMSFLAVGLYAVEAIPSALFWLLILRYPGSMAGALLLYFMRGPAELGPTLIGRATSFVLTLVLLAIALGLWLGMPWASSEWFDRVVLAVTVLVGGNALYLVYRGATWRGIRTSSAETVNSA